LISNIQLILQGDNSTFDTALPMQYTIVYFPPEAIAGQGTVPVKNFEQTAGYAAVCMNNVS
jgi:hypothetical protein